LVKLGEQYVEERNDEKTHCSTDFCSVRSDNDLREEEFRKTMYADAAIEKKRKEEVIGFKAILLRIEPEHKKILIRKLLWK
jgi:hypothetical protein